jgi:VIT1/CCC1 family predicted Fe2+/Mn2+ transporter
MTQQEVAPKLQDEMLRAQKCEITEHYIYEKLAKSQKDPHNQEVLEMISAEELEHYHFWRGYTHTDVEPSKWRIRKYSLIAKLFGLTFAIKLMERGEGDAQETYSELAEEIPEVQAIIEQEEDHEKKLIDMIEEERLKYVGSMVLGLNDALVELTGALAGLTFALRDTKLIALTGLITGIAAALSMGASEYLSTKAEEGVKKPGKAALYTGSAYILTVFLLIFPYLVFPNYYMSLGLTLSLGILVILFFTYYISVAKELPFKKRFLEMALISLGIAALSFAIGIVLSFFFGI